MRTSRFFSTGAPGSWRRKREDPDREPTPTRPAGWSPLPGLRSSRRTKEAAGRGPPPPSPCWGCSACQRGPPRGAGLHRLLVIPPRPRSSAPPCSRSSPSRPSSGRTPNWEPSAALASSGASVRLQSPAPPVRTPTRPPASPAFLGRAARRWVNRTGSGRCPGRSAKRSPPPRTFVPPPAIPSRPAAPPTTARASPCARPPPLVGTLRIAVPAPLPTPFTSSSSATRKPHPRPWPSPPPRSGRPSSFRSSSSCSPSPPVPAPSRGPSRPGGSLLRRRHFSFSSPSVPCSFRCGSPCTIGTSSTPPTPLSDWRTTAPS